MAVLMKVHFFWGMTVCQASIPQDLKDFFKVEQCNKNSCVGRRVHYTSTTTTTTTTPTAAAGTTAPQWARVSSFTRFLDHTQRHTTGVGLLWTSDQLVAETST
jgi:hypothetical protein